MLTVFWLIFVADTKIITRHDFHTHTSQTYVYNQSMRVTNYCVINSVINTLTALPRRTFVLRVFKP